jgi:2',3'-cyclic-nucleotide 2'-phosphodiesterase/3'-nucleotidase
MFAACLCAREVTVTVLATTDMHGNIYPYDYLSGTPAQRGLAKLGTLIQQERKSAPNALLVDCGDTIQGAQIESVYQQYVATGRLPMGIQPPAKGFDRDPMMLGMNYLRYDAMAVGNHEFNYGLKNFDKARAEAKFAWLSANTKTDPASGRKPFDAYIVKEVDGVKVGIIGITTPAVPTWEKPENYKGYSFVNAQTATENAVAELKSKHRVDVILVIAHSGLDEKSAGAQAGMAENTTRLVASIQGVDAIVFGHTHNQVADMRIGEVLLTQPKNWAISLSRMDVKLQSKSDGGYRVVSKSSRVIPATMNVSADVEILNMAAPYHEVAEKYLNTVVTQAKQAFDASTSRIEDTAIIDAIHRVQLHYAKADVSFASSFNLRAAVAKGPVTIRQIASMYLYDNELYAVEGDGRMVKDALENAARYFNTCADASCTNSPLINSAVIGYNYDMAQGVTYEIDVTRPVGNRIRNLQFQGRPLAADQKLRIAVNNYRAAGSNGYAMFQKAKLVWRSYDDIRDLIVRYYTDHELPAGPDNNWTIVPAAARQSLEIEVRRDRASVSK